MASLLFGTGAIINTLTPNATVVGNTGAAAAQFVVLGLVGAGSLTIQDRGSLTTLVGGALGQPLGRGDVTVTGPGSVWTNINGVIQVGGNQQGSISTLTVADGGLVNGSFFGVPISVGGGGGFGVLRGDGTVTSTQINSRGVLAPGVFAVPGPVGTPGAMSVFGNLAFQSGAFYVVQVNPTTASTTNVSGTASLAGTVGAVFAPGSYMSRAYTILTAAGGRHRHVRRPRHLRLAGRLRGEIELYRQYRITQP